MKLLKHCVSLNLNILKLYKNIKMFLKKIIYTTLLSNGYITYKMFIIYSIKNNLAPKILLQNLTKLKCTKMFVLNWILDPNIEFGLFKINYYLCIFNIIAIKCMNPK